MSPEKLIEESKNEDLFTTKINEILESSKINEFIDQNTILALDLGSGEISPEPRSSRNDGLSNVLFTVTGRTADLHSKTTSHEPSEEPKKR